MNLKRKKQKEKPETKQTNKETKTQSAINIKLLGKAALSVFFLSDRRKPVKQKKQVSLNCRAMGLALGLTDYFAKCVYKLVFICTSISTVFTKYSVSTFVFTSHHSYLLGCYSWKRLEYKSEPEQ